MCLEGLDETSGACRSSEGDDDGQWRTISVSVAEFYFHQ